MPNMGGLELTRTLRSREDGRDVLILMVTSHDAPEDIAAVVEAGVNGFLSKPFVLEVFQEKVRDMLSQSG